MTTEEELEALRSEVKQIRAALRSRRVFLVEYMTDEGPGWATDLLNIHSSEGGALVDVLAVARGLPGVNDAPHRPVLIRPAGFGGTWIVQVLRKRWDSVTHYYMRDGVVTPVEIRHTNRYHVRSGHWRIRAAAVNP